VESNGPAIAPSYEPSFAPELGPEQPERGATAKLWLLWQQRAFLWRVVWITTVVSVVVAFIIPVRYKSTAELVVGENSGSSPLSALLNKSSGAGSGLALGMDPATLLGLKTPGAFYVEVLKSRTVQDRLVEKFDLRTHYSKKYYQDARKKLNRMTDIDEDKKSGVITLSVTDWDPRFAAALARSYIEEMNRVAAGLNTSAAHREREFLEERLKSAKQDLDLASLQLSEFSSKHTMMDVQQQGRAMMDAAARLQGELIASQSELKGLEQIYSDDNVRVRSLKARIGELQAQLRKMVGSYTTPGNVTDSTEGDSPSIRTLPALGYRYQDLYREAKTQESIYDFLTQQYELARVEEAKELPVVRVMDQPNVPEKKNSPIRSLVVGLSVFVAFVLGCVWVMEREKWERLPAHDSRRMLASEVGADVKATFKKILRR
jgi:uncharacterized protein involved in exopolysaccharide biosynthesis